MFFRFAYPIVFGVGLFLWTIFLWAIFFRQKNIVYRYSCTSLINKAGFAAASYKFWIIKSLRMLTLLALIALAGRPQRVDVRSLQNIDGVDMVLALDVSESMNFYDDGKGLENRISVAKKEAINFIKQRTNDEIGVVIFATSFLKIAPPTFDKRFLEQSIGDLKIGFIEQNSTALGKGLAASVAALRNSNAKSKIIILLTDGMPTAKDDIPLEKAVEMAKSYNVKVYTIGIGSKTPLIRDYSGYLTRLQDSSFDETILKEIADKTGGQYFAAHNPVEMKMVYEKIDKLEKSTQNTEIFTKYAELFWPFFLVFVLTLFTEVFLTAFLWKLL